MATPLNPPRQNSAPADIIIATRGRGVLIDGAIRSVLASDNPGFTLWIIDQSRDDKTQVTAEAINDPRIRYRRLTSAGVSIARNVGASLSSSPYLLFTDDDCRVCADWLSEMLNELADPGTWGIFGRVLPDELSRSEIRPGSRPVSPAIRLALKDSDTREVYQGNRFNLGFGHGASMGFRRECFEAVGGFDDTLGAGGRFRSWPERDLGYRMLARGGRLVYSPRPLVYHRHWRDWEEVRRTYRNYGIGAGAATIKYMRCGDRAAWRFLAEWIADQGLRQVASGALKWHSWQKMEIGLLQLVFPWVGLFKGMRFPIDRAAVKYRDA